jgi:hypothetical protein
MESAYYFSKTFREFQCACKKFILKRQRWHGTGWAWWPGMELFENCFSAAKIKVFLDFVGDVKDTRLFGSVKGR